jgi:restriction system protein
VSVSTVPLPAAFFHPILVVLSEFTNGVRRRDIHEPVADLMGLTSAQREEFLPSGAHLRYQHRLGWGLNMLKTAGYVEAPAQGSWMITARGKQILSKYPHAFDEEATRRIVRESRVGPDEDGEASADEEQEHKIMTADQTPEERIQNAILEINATLAKDLLQRILQVPPAFFEILVLDLLQALGYGSKGDSVQHVGRSGDGGIDGIISLDKLGLEKVYVQAKRWEASVGRPEIQAFFGALVGRGAKKGVFITTSNFTREAREYGERVGDSVVLVDGSRLTSLMVENGVGVIHKPIRLPRIDADYFSDT